MIKAKSLYDLLVGFIEECDMVSVVRCKDCIHMHDNDCPIHWGKTENDFCSYGERGDSDGKND